jgi:hypothetical protein
MQELVAGARRSIEASAYADYAGAVLGGATPWAAATPVR